ncbi:hypothetical protein Tco_0840595 [Tanacetum coccineum]|uniref:Uncharacterized protein n=1 Tax=Tanacetum coccineum TaxID=301880 RepID=A0ABQ5AXJ0_9ASTR
MGNVKKSITERTRHQRQYDRRVNKRQMQTQESKVDTSKGLDADIRPVYDGDPMAEIQLTVEVNSHAKKQSYKTRNRNIPVEKKSDAKKPERRISKGQKFSANKSSTVPTGKTVGTCHNTNDSAIPLGKETCSLNTVICANSSSLSAVTNGNPYSVNIKHHRGSSNTISEEAYFEVSGKEILASTGLNQFQQPFVCN